MTSLFRISGLLLAALPLAGCFGAGAPAPVAVHATERLATDRVPWHAKTTLAAVIMRLRGASEGQVAGDTGVRGAAAVESDPTFTYDGFAVRQVKIRHFAAVEDDPGLRRLSGYLHFQDPAGRRAALVFSADYRVGPDGVTIEEAVWLPLFPDYPRVEVFVVARDALAAVSEAEAASYGELYARVSGAAIAMRDSAAASVNKRDYAIVAFAKDALAPGATFALGISAEQWATASFRDETRYMAFDGGWAVAVLPANFALWLSDAFWVKVVYAPGLDVAEEERKERLVGLFRTVPGAASEEEERAVTTAGAPPAGGGQVATAMAADSRLETSAEAGGQDADDILARARGRVGPAPDAPNAMVNQAELPEIVVGRQAPS